MAWSEKQLREAGLIQLKVRVRAPVLEALDAICGKTGETRGEVIARLIEKEGKRK